MTNDSDTPVGSAATRAIVLRYMHFFLSSIHRSSLLQNLISLSGLEASRATAA